MASIFICYRREDSAAYARLLLNALHTHFGTKHQVFMDLDTLQPGDVFTETIERTVASCHVLIAVIGKQWLMITEIWLYQCVPAPDVTGEIGRYSFRLAFQNLDEQ